MENKRICVRHGFKYCHYILTTLAGYLQLKIQPTKEMSNTILYILYIKNDPIK